MTKSALCIGINDYPGTDSDLAGCVNDAADWAAALRKRGFEVATLLDRQAIGTGIRKAIRDLLARSKALSESAQSLLSALPWRGNALKLRALLEGKSRRPGAV